MHVKGHTLVWYQALPDWVSALPDAEAVDAALKSHIQGVVTHWKGKIDAWDVVNEAVADGSTGLRKSVFLDKLGPGFVEKAFRYAREADPDVMLFYNDYGGEGTGAKATGIYNLVKSLVDAGAPIDGVGFQMHIKSDEITKEVFAATMARYAALGLKVNISEMDVRIHDVPGDMAAKLEAQNNTYYGIVSACLAQPKCHAVTVWGVTDNYSWISDPNQTYFPKPDYPLLFDGDYAAKPAYGGVVSALMGL
jgi:endo-1,4-beta-xylanase